ncbi:hypothetical protein BKA62DRAFT_814127 [Auriculariales sp. MPI-PUGE-AT-0066]|nr:hypothetical protein BKA62DRAFT_814127 [Auriculariales sp. MPI-PUGE-AT-0066]
MLAITDDVLVLIFDIIVLGQPLRWPDATYNPERASLPFTLSAVCHHWRHLTRTTSRFWMYFGFPSDAASRGLRAQLRRLSLITELSHKQPLDVVFIIDSHTVNLDIGSCPLRIVDALDAIGSRCRTATLRLPESLASRMSHAMSCDAPHLASLSIWFDSCVTNLPNAPNLSRLSLSCEEPDFVKAGSQLPDLTSLVTLCPYEAVGELALNCFSLCGNQLPPIPQFATVRRLCLYGLLSQSMIEILSGFSSVEQLFLEAPPIVKWGMGESTQPDVVRIFSQFFPALERHVPPIWPKLRQIYLEAMKLAEPSEDELVSFLRARMDRTYLTYLPLDSIELARDRSALSPLTDGCHCRRQLEAPQPQSSESYAYVVASVSRDDLDLRAVPRVTTKWPLANPHLEALRMAGRRDFIALNWITLLYKPFFAIVFRRLKFRHRGEEST